MKSIFERFSKNKKASLSLIFLLFLATLAILAPWITPFSYEDQNIAARLEPPSVIHWMGTDNLGRDMYSRILYGARVSLTVGLMTALFALVLGTITGAFSGYFGGRLDEWMMRIVDLFTMFPLLLLSILLTLIFGRGLTGITIAICFATWITQARLVRGLVLQLKEYQYVTAAKALGLGPFKIIFRHILPNLSGPILVSLSFQIPTNIMTESFLSFMGLGIQPPHSSWGTLANEGFRAMNSFPHLILYPGIVLFLAMLAFSYLGEGLKEAFDIQSVRGGVGGLGD